VRVRAAYDTVVQAPQHRQRGKCAGDPALGARLSDGRCSPDTVSLQAAVLAKDLVDALRS